MATKIATESVQRGVNMKKEVEKEIVIKQTIHQFYCDECGKYLGETNECFDDGYYDEIGRFKLDFCDNNNLGRYLLDKFFCDTCKTNFLNKLDEAFVNLGFIKIR